VGVVILKKLLLLTGPQGSGNHIFSRIYSIHSEVKGWDAILENYWVPTDEDYFAQYFVDPSQLTIEMFDGSEYFVTDISCPFVYDGNITVPKIQEFCDKVSSFGIEVIVGIIVRDEHINTEQQKRLRKGRTLDVALDTYNKLNYELEYLSLESLFLHKQNYLKWLAKVIDFPLDYNNPNVFKFLDESPNKKYVKYVDDYWLDETVKKGLKKFSERE
jgi:hypothetical protein